MEQSDLRAQILCLIEDYLLQRVLGLRARIPSPSKTFHTGFY